jgi:transposase
MLCHMLIERNHCLSEVRAWAAERQQTFATLLDVVLRETDCTDDRLAKVLTMLGDPSVQAPIDTMLLRDWIQVYALPTDVVRLDSTSVSVYHDPAPPTPPTDGSPTPASVIQFGHSKDHRPDLRQFKLMLASLDPLGMPLVTQLVGGQCADDGLYVPAYHAVVQTLGTAQILLVGDSKMGALATRGQIVAGGSAYLTAYHPPQHDAERAAWITQALARSPTWQHLERVDARTGDVHRVAEIDCWTREQPWAAPQTGQVTLWTERVLVVQSQSAQVGEQRTWEQRRARLLRTVQALQQPTKRGRKSYRTEAALREVVVTALAEARMTDLIRVDLVSQMIRPDEERWMVGTITVDADAWQAQMQRLGWQVYVTNTTDAQHDVVTLVETYRHQPIAERGFARLKSGYLHIRPIYLRDEQRIAGLAWLLSLALRVLTLTEHRLRSALAERQEAIVGLNPASRTQATTRPTTERVIAAFRNLTVTTMTDGDHSIRHVSPLDATQRHILSLLGISVNWYERLASTESNWIIQMRE